MFAFYLFLFFKDAILFGTCDNDKIASNTNNCDNDKY